ncbi:MAG: hypothetical protein JST00_45485 [Deltaproteobacteria bacterium]|nr:hypothetical protein [Deltaproteobacteria bacterium]
MSRRIGKLFESGYWSPGRLWGAPFRVHWTTPVGLLVLTRFSFDLAVWAALTLIIVVHELGHVFLARRYGLRVVSIDLTALGGVCRLAGDPTRREAAIVAWGGVLAQGALLVAALLLKGVLHVVAFGVMDGVFDTLVHTNLAVAAFNLLPIAPLDGKEAWRLFTR